MIIQYKGVDGKESPTRPTRGTPGAAGWDLYLAEDVTLYPYQPQLVPTDLEVAIPEGHMLLILPRSSHPKRGLIVANAPGLIDEDYRGHLKVWLNWMPHPDETKETKIDPGEGSYDISAELSLAKGDRVAQAVLVPYYSQTWVQVEALPATDRGSGGFGSTG